MDDWYIIQLKLNGHEIAKRNLRRQGFNSFLPLHQVTRRRGRNFIKVLKPLFPGYMFVSVRPKSADWRIINNTLGVSRLVIFGDKPQPLPPMLVTELMKRCDNEDVLLPHNNFQAGDSVEVLNGPFTEFIATVETVESKNRIWLLMDLLGSETRVQHKKQQLRPI